MKKNPNYYEKLLFVSVLLALPVAACQKPVAPPEDTSAVSRIEGDSLVLTGQAAANAKVTVQKVGPGQITQALSYQGEITGVPEKFAAIVARLEGVIVSIEKKEGDKVSKGEKMVTIESRKLAESKLAYLESEQKLRFARSALEREAALLEKKISSKEAYQEAVHAKEEAQLNHAAGLQRLKLLGFSEPWLHKLEKNPNQKMTVYTLRAPFDGEVIAKEVTVGEAVAEDKVLFQLADLSELIVEVKVPLSAVRIFKQGMPVTVTNHSLELRSPGRVRTISSLASPSTRTVSVKVSINNEDGNWRPGTPATVELDNRKVDAAVVVPLGAVHEMDGAHYAFLDKGGNRFQRKKVTPGAYDEKRLEITDGLHAGDTVAVGNSLTLKSEWMKRAGE